MTYDSPGFTMPSCHLSAAPQRAFSSKIAVDRYSKSRMPLTSYLRSAEAAQENLGMLLLDLS
jgi:hypothetical protein